MSLSQNAVVVRFLNVVVVDVHDYFMVLDFGTWDFGRIVDEPKLCLLGFRQFICIIEKQIVRQGVLHVTAEAVLGVHHAPYVVVCGLLRVHQYQLSSKVLANQEHVAYMFAHNATKDRVSRHQVVDHKVFEFIEVERCLKFKLFIVSERKDELNFFQLNTRSRYVGDAHEVGRETVQDTNNLERTDDTIAR